MQWWKALLALLRLLFGGAPDAIAQRFGPQGAESDSKRAQQWLSSRPIRPPQCTRCCTASPVNGRFGWRGQSFIRPNGAVIVGHSAGG
jgi:hypothetical protein